MVYAPPCIHQPLMNIFPLLFVSSFLFYNWCENKYTHTLSQQSSWDPRPIAEIPVQLPRSLSNCWDPVWSKINPLPLLQLHSDHPLILRHYTNQNPKLWVPPNPLTHFLSLSELQMTSENPNHISVFICLHHSVLVLLNSKFIFMSLSQFSPFCFQYIEPFQYSHSLVLASALPLTLALVSC